MSKQRITPIITECWPDVSGFTILENLKAARAVIAHETAHKLFKTGLFNPSIIIGDESIEREIIGDPCACFMKAIPDDLSAGKCLLRAIDTFNPEKTMCFGGGSCLFLSDDELKLIYENTQKGRYVSNSSFSSDFVSFYSSDIKGFEDSIPNRDNDFTFFLRYDVDLEPFIIPNSLGSSFDVDSPSDLSLLSKFSKTPKRILSFLKESPFNNCKPLDDILRVLSSRGGEVLIWGRVNPSNAIFIDRSSKCRLRIISEERGMKTREKKCISVMGDMSDQRELLRFISTLKEIFNAALIDSRPIFSSFDGLKGREDAFLSDMGIYSEIQNPFIRAFAEGIRDSGVPVLLGGHSLVSGGLILISEIIGDIKK